MAADVRATAARALGKVLAGSSLNQVLPTALDRVDAPDRPLLQQLCYGTLRGEPLYQALLGKLLDKPLKSRDSDVQALLLLGLYQLQDSRIPDHAAVAETVAATARLKKPWARGLCNALLRRFLRERDTLLEGLSPAEAAAHPAWLYRKLHSQWPARFEQILDAANQQPPMTLRINRRRGDRGAYLQQLRQADIAAHPGGLCTEAIYLESPVDVTRLPNFAAGAVSVQDEAAQLAAQVLAVKPGERLLDACAAPGGKTCHILEIQPGLSEMVASDVEPARLQRVEENLSRLQLKARCIEADASAPGALRALAPFDRILVDAPCSATGVIRRHPDIKCLRREADIPALAELQLSILQGLWPLLRGGGRLVYATCSVLREENDAVIDRFLQATADARGVTIDADWGTGTAHGRQLLPTREGPDGLYYAALEKQ